MYEADGGGFVFILFVAFVGFFLWMKKGDKLKKKFKEIKGEFEK